MCLYREQIEPNRRKTCIFFILGSFFCPSHRFLSVSSESNNLNFGQLSLYMTHCALVGSLRWEGGEHVNSTAVDVMVIEGRAVDQAVSRRPATAEARFGSRVSPCGIRVGQSVTGTGFFPEYFGFPRQFHSTGAPLLGKVENLIIIFLFIFIIGFQSKPQGCGCSVAFAAGPFSTQKKRRYGTRDYVVTLTNI
jgi:hypothetical protein